MSEKIVIRSYQPKTDKREDLLSVLRNHAPLLKKLGFATDYPTTLLESDSGEILEIFEWKSADAIKKAGEHPRIKRMWSEIQSLCDEEMLPQFFKRLSSNKQNRVVHFEINADDTERCARFYERLFRWDVNQWGNLPYWMIRTGDESSPGINGGIIKRREENGNVANTINVENLDERLEDVVRFGGSVTVPKLSAPGVGYIAYAKDTEGNTFGMMQSS